MKPTEAISAATSSRLLEAAATLGAWVLDHESSVLAALHSDRRAEQQVCKVADIVLGDKAALDSVARERVNVGNWVARSAPELAWVVLEELRPLALLRAICLGPLRLWFDRCQGTVALEYGTPFPFPQRLAGVGHPPLTTPRIRQAENGLLPGVPFDLCRRTPNEPLHVAMDFSRRTLLDAATWSTPQASLEPESWGPVAMAVVNPYNDFDEDVAWEIDEPDSYFFWVRPKAFDRDGLLQQLAAAARGGAKIAVLPELTMPEAEALGIALADNPSAFPAVVVAGSAHQLLAESKANVCCTYIHGVEVLRHLKRERMQLRLGDRQYAEGLAHVDQRLMLLSGSSTRLGVLICADLHNTELVSSLAACGVNLALVPTMTPSASVFQTRLREICHANQGVGLLANTVSLPHPTHIPFQAILVQPVQDQDVASETISATAERATAKGWLLIRPWEASRERRLQWNDWEPVAD